MISWWTILATLGATTSAHAYNHEQHQGMVALGYKAMAAAALERNCAAPLDFGEGEPPPSLRTYPEGYCIANDASCQPRWEQFLDDIERGIVFLHGVNSSLAPPQGSCPDPGANAPLGDVEHAVDRYYAREAGTERNHCGVFTGDQNGCSQSARLCNADAIYRQLAAEDHTGDVLGYWATEPDDDASAAVLGVKPTNAGGLGQTINTVNTVVEDTLTALLIPIVCAVNFFRTGDLDCGDDARSLADDLTPVEELHGLMPVFGNFRDADAYSGLWHFQQHVPGASNRCDDIQGVFYEEAGPRRVPDALDIAITAIGDLTGLTLDYDDSTGPVRFNITDPDDGDAPSCARDRAEWEITTLGHTEFSPLDNLALYGWKRFADSTDRQARDLGWPLHALGDAVAPHHVTATTGWGHRGYEDAAEVHWLKIVHIDSADDEFQRRRNQYEMLRNILAHAFLYAQILDQLRLTHPGPSPHHAIPVRAFVTTVASHTYQLTTEPGSGAPLWPFDPSVSVPYALGAGAIESAVVNEVYGTESSILHTRNMIERGAGAIAAFLSDIWRVAGAQEVPALFRCTETPGGGLFECSGDTACFNFCCAPVCADACSLDSECGGGELCTNGCCEPTACENPCVFSDQCPAGLICQANCCVTEVR
ncbi:MAG: hypothetical protein AB2A00_30905 [Myxococcota bacterium]